MAQRPPPQGLRGPPPHTPWAIRFHPFEPYVLATGCIGYIVIVWDIETEKQLNRCIFGASISCVAFHPNGMYLAVTSGRKLYLWDYVRDSRPLTLKMQDNPFHLVDFHPSGKMIMVGRKNLPTQDVEEPLPYYTLRLEVYEFDAEQVWPGRLDWQVVLEVPKVIAYNDGGIHFSPCGQMINGRQETKSSVFYSKLQNRDPKPPSLMYGFSVPRRFIGLLDYLAYPKPACLHCIAAGVIKDLSESRKNTSQASPRIADAPYGMFHVEKQSPKCLLVGHLHCVTMRGSVEEQVLMRVNGNLGEKTQSNRDWNK